MAGFEYQKDSYQHHLYRQLAITKGVHYRPHHQASEEEPGGADKVLRREYS